MTLLCADLFHTFSGKHEHAHRMAKLRRAPKFVIDDMHHESIASWAEETVEVSQTLTEALEAGRVTRLPFPEILIEWWIPPVVGHKILTYVVQQEGGGLSAEAYVYGLRPGWKKPRWGFGGEHFGPSIWLTGAVKLLAMLDADMTVKERVLAANLKKNWNGSPRTKPYDYTVLRAPVEYIGPTAEGTGQGTARRMHLVRGYQWGRHTRPIEEQKWIKPFWRGDASLGVVRRDHYRVAGTGQ